MNKFLKGAAIGAGAANSLFVTVCTILTVVASVVGIVMYYSGNHTSVFWCAVLIILEAILQKIRSSENRFPVLIITAVISLIVALIFKLSILPCIAVGLCWLSTVFYGFGLLFMLVTAICGAIKR